jgi:hypothetical protein
LTLAGVVKEDLACPGSSLPEATSNKQQATSNKQQASSNMRQYVQFKNL